MAARPRYQQPPAYLCELLDLVLGDLQGAAPIVVQVGWDPAWVLPRAAIVAREEPPTPLLIFSEPDHIRA